MSTARYMRGDSTERARAPYRPPGGKPKRGTAMGFVVIGRPLMRSVKRPFLARPTAPWRRVAGLGNSLAVHVHMTAVLRPAAARIGTLWVSDRPPPAIPASKHSRRQWPESRWSSHSSRLQARRAISKAARQGSATPASMKSCSNGRGPANRIDAIDSLQTVGYFESSRQIGGNRPLRSH